MLVRQLLRRATGRPKAPDVHRPLVLRLRPAGEVDPLAVRRTDGIHVLEISRPEDLLRIRAVAIGDIHRVATGGLVDIDARAPSGDHAGVLVPAGRKRSRRAAASRARHQSQSVAGIEPDLRAVGGKPELPHDESAGRERWEVLSQIGEATGADLMQPDVLLAVVIREKGDELAVGRDFRALFGAVPVGEQRKLRVGQRSSTEAAAFATVPSSQPRPGC